MLKAKSLGEAFRKIPRFRKESWDRRVGSGLAICGREPLLTSILIQERRCASLSPVKLEEHVSQRKVVATTFCIPHLCKMLGRHFINSYFHILRILSVVPSGSLDTVFYA